MTRHKPIYVLDAIQLDNFRNYSSAFLKFNPNMNVILGDNGSGKSAVLEAIHTILVGRSFRSSVTTRHLVQTKSNSFRIQAKLIDTISAKTNSKLIELHKDLDGNRRLSANNELVEGGLRSVVRLLPLMCFSPDTGNLVDVEPEKRRKLLDWAVFHVEPNFINKWSEFQNTLKQRNKFLKSDNRYDVEEYNFWTEQFIKSSHDIHEARLRIYSDIVDFFDQAIQSFNCRVNVEYSKGWLETSSLEEQLHTSYSQEMHRRYTVAGPHRADLIFKCDNASLKNTFSRGEKKFVSLQFMLSQVEYLTYATGAPPLVLFDDIIAELDNNLQALVFDKIHALKCQAIITATSLPNTLLVNKDSFDKDYNVFHVEHGSLISSTSCFNDQ